MEIACSCPQWPGPHSHITPRVRVRLPSGVETTFTYETLTMNQWANVEVLEEIPAEIRPWVDWKQVAHDLMTTPTL